MQAGREQEALAFLENAGLSPDPHFELETLRLGVLIEVDRLEEAGTLWEKLGDSVTVRGNRAGLRWLLMTGQHQRALEYANRLTPINGIQRRQIKLTRIALQREGGDPAGAAEALRTILTQADRSVTGQELRLELLLALKMAGAPWEELHASIGPALFPWERAQLATLTDGKPVTHEKNLFFSKRWADAKQLFQR